MTISTRLLGFTLPIVFLAACSTDVEDGNLDVSSTYSVHIATIGQAPTPPVTPTNELAGQCLEQSPARTSLGDPDCVVLVPSAAGSACACDSSKAQRVVGPAEADARAALAADPQAQASGWDCYCAVESLLGAAADACRTDPSLDMQSPYDGYCTVDMGSSPPIGAPGMLESCPSNSAAFVRLLGHAKMAQDPAGVTYMAVVCKTPTP